MKQLSVQDLKKLWKWRHTRLGRFLIRRIIRVGYLEDMVKPYFQQIMPIMLADEIFSLLREFEDNEKLSIGEYFLGDQDPDVPDLINLFIGEE